jgi:hypothetical protein
MSCEVIALDWIARGLRFAATLCDLELDGSVMHRVRTQRSV